MTNSKRKRLDWNIIKTPKDWLILLNVTFLGSGLLPKAPGTWGSLATLPLLYGISDWNLLSKILLCLLVLGFGTWGSTKFSQLTQSSDHQFIVIDEVLGMLVSALPLGSDPTFPQILSVFVIFRFFDVTKIYPTHRIDSWSHDIYSKTGNYLYTGFGVMADDLMAGLQTAVCIWGLIGKGIL
jgi:phosphatidylglycerophosphatase A